MVTLGRYATASTVGATAVILHAFYSRDQFYPAMVHLATSKVSRVLLLNMGLVLIFTAWQLTKSIFLGKLREIEVERLHEQLLQEFMEILFAMSVFRNELNTTFLALVIVLLFTKAFHWLAQTRVEFIETTPSVSKVAHARIIGFMTLLLTMDCIMFSNSFSHLLKTRQASVSLFFALEYIIMASATVVTFVKYFFYLGDLMMDGKWEKKSICVFYLELIRDLLHLSLYLFFFLVIFKFKGLPLHLAGELYKTFRNFKTRVADFIRYRNATSNMDTRFPDATAEELERGDATCIICREEMSAAKKLPCNHLFHTHCLRSWLERQQTCPTCSSSVLAPRSGTQRRGPAAAGPAPPAIQPQQPEAGSGGNREGNIPNLNGQAPVAANREANGLNLNGQVPNDANGQGNGMPLNGQVPIAANLQQQERLQATANWAASQYQSSYVYPVLGPDGATWYPAYLAFVPQAYLAAMLGAGQNAAASASANFGSEQGNEGTGKGLIGEPILASSQAQFWQAWAQRAQMTMQANPTALSEWQAATGALQRPSGVVNGQIPAQGDSGGSSAMAESSQAAGQNKVGGEQSIQNPNVNLKGKAFSTIYGQQFDMKQGRERQPSLVIGKQSQPSQNDTEASTSSSKDKGKALQ